MVRSLRGHFFAPGKHRLRAWTWLRASMSSQCQTILQQCSAHLQLEVVLIALKNACSGTKFVESSQSSLNYMYGAVTRKLLLRCARSHLYVHRPSHCFGCFKSHVNLSKSSHWWHGLCKLLHSKLLLHVHYYSLLILIHRYTQHPATETSQGSRPRQQDLYDLDGYRRMQSFLRKLILQHVCSTRHLQTPSNCCMKNSGNLRQFMPFMPDSDLDPRIVASNRLLLRRAVAELCRHEIMGSSFTCRRGCHIWGHQHFDHWRRDCLNGRERLRLQRCCLKALLSCRTSGVNKEFEEITTELQPDIRWSDRIRSSLRYPSGSTRKNVLKDGNQSLLILETPEHTSCLCTEPNSTGIGWLTSVGHPGKMFRLIWSSQLQRQNAGNLQSLQGIRQIYTYVYIYILYIYVWGSGLVQQESQEISRHLHNMEPPSCKLVCKPHQL
jgi:hypothetical protein